MVIKIFEVFDIIFINGFLVCVLWYGLIIRERFFYIQQFIVLIINLRNLDISLLRKTAFKSRFYLCPKKGHFKKANN